MNVKKRNSFCWTTFRRKTLLLTEKFHRCVNDKYIIEFVIREGKLNFRCHEFKLMSIRELICSSERGEENLLPIVTVCYTSMFFFTLCLKHNKFDSMNSDEHVIPEK